MVLVAAVWLALPASANASSVKFHGWTADGKAVVFDERAPWDGLGACTPAGFDKDGKALQESCAACGTTAAECKVTSKPVASLKSPDKKLTLVKSQDCYVTGHDADMTRCVQTITVQRLGAVEHEDETTDGRKKAKVATYFRPDSGAVAITFTGGSSDDDKWVIDLAEYSVRDRVPAIVTKLLERQAKVTTDAVYSADAVLFTDDTKLGALTPPELAKVVGASTTTTATEIEPSFDGHAAWASFVATTADNRLYRVTQLFVRDAKNEWAIASGMWSLGRADADANAKAAAGLPVPAEVARKRQDLPDGLSVLGSMLRDGDPELLASMSRRPRTMIVGTAPAERFLGGGKLASAWKAWFAAGVRGVRVRGELSPRGTTGWIMTNVNVTKKTGATTYKLPVRVWMVVDASDGVAAEVVASHAAVAL